MSLNLKNNAQETKAEKKKSSAPKWLLPTLLWLAAFVCVALMGIVIAQRTPVIRGTNNTVSGSVDTSLVENIVSNPGLPEMNAMETDVKAEAVPRLASSITHIPENVRTEAVTYTIETGDSLYGIANKFGLEPETVLWAN